MNKLLWHSHIYLKVETLLFLSINLNATFFDKHKPVHKGEAEVEMQEVLAESETKAAISNTSVKKSSAHHLPPSNTTEKPKGK